MLIYCQPICTLKVWDKLLKNPENGYIVRDKAFYLHFYLPIWWNNSMWNGSMYRFCRWECQMHGLAALVLWLIYLLADWSLHAPCAQQIQCTCSFFTAREPEKQKEKRTRWHKQWLFFGFWYPPIFVFVCSSCISQNIGDTIIL